MVWENSKNKFPSRTGQTSQTSLTCPTCMTIANRELIFRTFLWKNKGGSNEYRNDTGKCYESWQNMG